MAEEVAVAMAEAAAAALAEALAVAVLVAGLTKRLFNQKDFLINVWG